MRGDKAMTSLQSCPPNPTLTRMKTKPKHGDIKVCILKQNNGNKHSKSQPSFWFSVILLVPRWMLLTLKPQLFPVWMGILQSSFFLSSSFIAPLYECRWDPGSAQMLFFSTWEMETIIFPIIGFKDLWGHLNRVLWGLHMKRDVGV